MKAYQLKITLKETHPPIWRRCIVPAGYSFSQLSVIIEFVMGWSGYHLTSHSFNSLGIEFIEEAEEEGFSSWSDVKLLESSEYIIDEYLDQVKSYTFTYDFGDDWEHQVQIEKIIEDYEVNYPQVIKYRGNLPQEDCGGVWGYDRLKNILADPNDPEYEEMMEWSGGSAESEYDLEEVNECLSGMFLKNRKARPKTEAEILEDVFSGKDGFYRINVPKHSPDDALQKPGSLEEKMSQMFLDALQKQMEDTRMAPERAIHDLTMILLYLTRFQDARSKANRAWKNYDFAAIDRLNEEGYIDKGSNGSKSAYITDEGLDYARTLLNIYGIRDWERK